MSFFFFFFFFFFNDTATTEIYTLSLHDALPISRPSPHFAQQAFQRVVRPQTPPVLARERVVVQRLFDPRYHQRRSIRQLHLFQFRGDLLGLLPRGGAIFLRVNRLQHRRHFF